MATYKRPIWVWMLVLASGLLVTFAAYSAFYYYEGDRYWLYTNLSPRPEAVSRQTYEEECVPRYWWEDPPTCPIAVEPPTIADSLFRGALVGLLSLVPAHLVARIPERRIRDLEEVVEGFDTGQITPSRRGK